MKLTLNLVLLLFVLLTFSDFSYSLTDYQIKKICKKQKRVTSCIKNLQKKKYSHQKGNPIEIPVIPFKR